LTFAHSSAEKIPKPLKLPSTPERPTEKGPRKSGERFKFFFLKVGREEKSPGFT
jgi:hypothetical protein